MAHGVMPFDMAKTLHVFKMTESGGIQRVVVRQHGDVGQMELIRTHLGEEAKRFQRGDYSDPMKLHGSAMPGLAELEAAAGHIQVTYEAVANGAEIRFVTSDLHALTAIHRGFGTQLSERDAVARRNSGQSHSCRCVWCSSGT